MANRIVATLVVYQDAEMEDIEVRTLDAEGRGSVFGRGYGPTVREDATAATALREALALAAARLVRDLETRG